MRADVYLWAVRLFKTRATAAEALRSGQVSIGGTEIKASRDVKAARAIRAMGPKILILKKGEHGALLFGENDEIFFAPALPLADVVDPTGAGDTFAGGFVGYLDSVGDYSFDSMKRGLMYAATMASFCVEAFGPERMMDLTDEAIRARRADFSQLIQVG